MVLRIPDLSGPTPSMPLASAAMVSRRPTSLTYIELPLFLSLQ